MQAPASVALALGLGANLGDPERQLRTAIDSLSAILGPLRVADLYRSRAHGIEDQPDYLNTAATGRTTLPPDAILAIAKQLEHAAGRRPGQRFGPRPLDIDLLLFGDRRLSRPGMVLPHPRLLERRFALAPLADVAADWEIPGSGLTVAEALARVGQEDAVTRVGWRGHTN
ncbi:MAG: 2-amino-4-hydroxy-6-hydroxymethyldihydropteridine diphosphokinase [Thermoanaerobaculia bacterium]